MPNRLEELRKQRARLLEVLSWIEGEIIAEGSANRPATGELPPASWPAPAPLPETPKPGEAEADLIIEQYRDESTNLTQSVRSGCFLYFALALGLLVASVVAWYLLTPRRH